MKIGFIDSQSCQIQIISPNLTNYIYIYYIIMCMKIKLSFFLYTLPFSCVKISIIT